MRFAIRRDQRERLDIGDEGRQCQAAPVHVCRQAAAKRKPVGAGLLLAYAPVGWGIARRTVKPRHQCGPMQPGLRAQLATYGVEFEHSRHGAHVDLQTRIEKLLPAHGVATATNRHAEPFTARVRKR